VFWEAGSTVTLGASSTFRGNMFTYSAITIGDDIILDGRAGDDYGANHHD
jgi:hypothetical protein